MDREASLLKSVWNHVLAQPGISTGHVRFRQAVFAANNVRALRGCGKVL